LTGEGIERNYSSMLQRGYRFLIRLIGNRNLLWAGREMLAAEIARSCPLPYAQTVVKMDDAGRRCIILSSVIGGKIARQGRAHCGYW